MRINPLFKWFGSKWQSAKRYPQPEHARIVEPFAGGAGYALNHTDRAVTLWDSDPHLCVLWPWLINASSEEIRDIPIGLAIGTDIRTLGLTAGQSLLLKSWQRTNSVGDCWTTSKWGNLPGQWTENTRARVSEQVHAIRHWVFTEDFLWNESLATYFVDPPYVYNYRYRAAPVDYLALGAQLRGLASAGNQVIACEAQSKLGEIPTWLNFTPSHSAVTSRRKNARSSELVWTGKKGASK